MPASADSLLSNWAALIALWAVPYLTLLHRLGLDAADSTTLQWLLLAIAALGIASVLHAAWRDTQNPRWRAAHGLLKR
jgi:hypothetical protein